MGQGEQYLEHNRLSTSRRETGFDGNVERTNVHDATLERVKGAVLGPGIL